MAEGDSKRDKGHAGAPDAKPAPTSSDSRDPGSACASAEVAFQQQVEQCRTKLAQGYAEQYANYNNAIAAAQKDLGEACAHAWQRYRQELDEAWAAGEMTTQAGKAQEQFAALFNELSAHLDSQRSVPETYMKFADRLARGQTPHSGSDEVTEQHQAYLSALEQATGVSEAYKRAAESHAQYLLLMRKLHDERWTRAYSAYGNYIKAVNDALAATRFPVRANAAIESSIAGLQAAWQEAQDEYRIASAALLKSLQAAMEEGSRPRSS